MSAFDRAEDAFFIAFAAFLALCMAFFVGVVIYMGGWSVGLWPMSCKFESSQPKCVKAGWGHHNDVTVRGVR